MSCFPQNGTGQSWITYPIGPPTNSSVYGNTLTAHSSANTKGAYVEFVASLPFTSDLLIVTPMFSNAASVGRSWLIDVATGGSGSETDVVPNLIAEQYSSVTTLSAARSWMLPLRITSGTRVAARIQGSVGGTTLSTALSFGTSGCQGPASYTVAGANTSTTRALVVDPGSTIRTKGSWVELVSSAATDYNAVLLTFTNAGNSVEVGSNEWAVDVGFGAAASEVVVVPDLRVTIGVNLGTPVPATLMLPLWVPSGTRVAVRAAADINDATDRLLGVTAHLAHVPASGGGGDVPRVGPGGPVF